MKRRDLLKGIVALALAPVAARAEQASFLAWNYRPGVRSTNWIQWSEKTIVISGPTAFAYAEQLQHIRTVLHRQMVDALVVGFAPAVPIRWDQG